MEKMQHRWPGRYGGGEGGKDNVHRTQRAKHDTSKGGNAGKTTLGLGWRVFAGPEQSQGTDGVTEKLEGAGDPQGG